MDIIKEAQRAFEDTHDPNVVSFTTLICGYLKKERFKDAPRVFRRMPERNFLGLGMKGGETRKKERKKERKKKERIRFTCGFPFFLSCFVTMYI